MLSSNRQWTDLHRLALAIGPLLVSMSVGFSSTRPGIGLTSFGQGIAGLLAVVLLALLRPAAAATESGQC